MKKTVMFLMITSCACTVSAHQSLEGLKNAKVHVHSTPINNDQRPDEYEHVANDQRPDEYEHVEGDDNLQEYEQHVCDHIKPPKISAAMALLSEVGGRMLIEFITIREALRRYLVALKVAIDKWIGCIITQ